MRITEVQVKPISDAGALKAIARVKFDDCFVINDMKIVLTQKGYIVAMPSRRLPDGTYLDVCHPLNKDMREILESAVMDAYREMEDGRAA